MRNHHNKDPKVITARFDSKCHETGQIIKKGEDCIYYPIGKSVYAMNSKQAAEFKSWSFDVECLGATY